MEAIAWYGVSPSTRVGPCSTESSALHLLDQRSRGLPEIFGVSAAPANTLIRLSGVLQPVDAINRLDEF